MRVLDTLNIATHPQRERKETSETKPNPNSYMTVRYTHRNKRDARAACDSESKYNEPIDIESVILYTYI